jgi:hypothetical protein
MTLKFCGSNQRIPEYHSWVCLCMGLGIRSYVELGCGSSHSFLSAGIPADRIVTVDILPNGLVGTGIRHLQANSYDPNTRNRVLEMLGEYPDVVFIDADHEADAVRKDFATWYPFANIALGFHDILMPSVIPAWNEISLRYPSVQIIARDLASADKWQHGGTHPDGHVNCGGIGVVFKEDL